MVPARWLRFYGEERQAWDACRGATQIIMSPLGALKLREWSPKQVIKWRGAGMHPEDLAKTGAKEEYFWAAQLGENVHGWVEFVNRAGYYEALRRSGYTPAQAAKYVKDAHFSYAELSTFEKNVARRLGPLFYGWQRKSIPFTMKKIAERPFGQTSQSIRALTIPQRDREEYIPGFMREKMSIPVSADGPETTYLSQLGLPIEDLNQLSFEGLMPQFKRIGQKNGQCRSPLPGDLHGHSSTGVR